jgi:hypothetical protein
LQVKLGSPHGTPGLPGGLHGRSSISGQPPPIRPLAALPLPAAVVAKDPLLEAEWYWGDITREEVCQLGEVDFWIFNFLQFAIDWKNNSKTKVEKAF